MQVVLDARFGRLPSANTNNQRPHLRPLFLDASEYVVMGYGYSLMARMGDFLNCARAVAAREADQILCQMPAWRRKNAISYPIVSLTSAQHHVE